ncbi:MAG TPA: hypothetical protein VF082_10705 [Jiangellaceae bacterium]
MIDTGDALRIAGAAAVGLSGIGLGIAWLPARRHESPATPVARLLLTAGLVAAILDLGGLGGVLGLALAAMGATAMWQSQPAPEVPRPRRKGIVVAAGVSGLLIAAVLRGWWLFERVPDQARTVSAVLVGSAAGLATLAAADRSRVRMRDAVRERLP